jgi:rhamnogalacturonan endolyase
MKNKNLLIGLCSVPLLLSISTNMIAQDLRERTYYYEILELPFLKKQPIGSVH